MWIELLLIETLAVCCFIAGRLTAKPPTAVKVLPVGEVLDPVTVEEQRLLKSLDEEGPQHGEDDE